MQTKPTKQSPPKNNQINLVWSVTYSTELIPGHKKAEKQIFPFYISAA